MVTRVMLGTGFMPSFCMALRLFFSDRLCLLREERSVLCSESTWSSQHTLAARAKVIYMSME